MWVLGLEAGGALFMLIFIVWWTMFAGRKPEQAARPRPAERQAVAPTDAALGENDTPGS